MKNFEELASGFRWESDSYILHAKSYPVRPVPFCLDERLPRAIVCRVHRVGSIAYQIKNHLLELDTIRGDERKAIGEPGFQDYSIPLNFA